MYEGPEFRHLRYFLAVAEECNFGRAARRLHVTQPALSIQIKQLEEGLKAILFLRGPAGASMTYAGRTLPPIAKHLLAMRKRAVDNTTLAHSGGLLPFRFGYSPWINRDVVHETITGYKEMVPNGIIEPSSQSSAPLSSRVFAGTLDAALVTPPIREQELMVQIICSEKLLVCLRADDPLAREATIPKDAIEARLKVMFDRDLHSLLFDQIERKLARAGIPIRPTDFVSHPTDMHFLVKENVGFGLVREGITLDLELTSRPISGVNLTIETAFICHELQQRPVLPLLAYRVAKCCADKAAANRRKKPVARVEEIAPKQGRIFG